MEESYADINFLEKLPELTTLVIWKSNFLYFMLIGSKEKYYLMMALGLRWVQR